MTTLVIVCSIAIVCLWMLIMYGIWRKTIAPTELLPGVTESLTPAYKKSTQFARKILFFMERLVQSVRMRLGKILIAGIVFLFPRSKKLFQKKNMLTGIKDGPSSYFLMSVSEASREAKTADSKIRRKRKNV